MTPLVIRGRIEVLDGLRGVAIALVMVHHFFLQIPAAARWEAVVFAIFHRGSIGVDLFFVLSGFLITGILLDAKDRPRYFINFFARRILRIFPAYYAVAIAFFVVIPALPMSPVCYNGDGLYKDQWWHWLYLTNIHLALHGTWYLCDPLIPNILWSLAIEEQFYLIWPLVIYYSSQRTLIATIAALFLVAFLFRWSIAFLLGPEHIAAYVLPFTRIDALASGALLAVFARNRAISMRLGSQSGTVLIIAVVGWALLEIADFSMMKTTFGYTMIWLLFALLLFHVLERPSGRLASIIQNPILIVLGTYSYGLYLWHGPARFMARKFVSLIGGPVLGSTFATAVVQALIAAILALTLAMLSWHLLEKHFLRLKDRFAG